MSSNLQGPRPQCMFVDASLATAAADYSGPTTRLAVARPKCEDRSRRPPVVVDRPRTAALTRSLVQGLLKRAEFRPCGSAFDPHWRRQSAIFAPASSSPWGLHFSSSASCRSRSRNELTVAEESFLIRSLERRLVPRHHRNRRRAREDHPWERSACEFVGTRRGASSRDTLWRLE